MQWHTFSWNDVRKFQKSAVKLTVNLFENNLYNDSNLGFKVFYNYKV